MSNFSTHDLSHLSPIPRHRLDPDLAAAHEPPTPPPPAPAPAAKLNATSARRLRPRRGGSRLPLDRARIEAMHVEERSTGEIAAEFGCSSATIGNRLREWGLSPTGKRRPRAPQARADQREQPAATGTRGEPAALGATTRASRAPGTRNTPPARPARAPIHASRLAEAEAALLNLAGQAVLLEKAARDALKLLRRALGRAPSLGVLDSGVGEGE